MHFAKNITSSLSDKGKFLRVASWRLVEQTQCCVSVFLTPRHVWTSRHDRPSAHCRILLYWRDLNEVWQETENCTADQLPQLKSDQIGLSSEDVISCKAFSSNTLYGQKYADRLFTSWWIPASCHINTAHPSALMSFNKSFNSLRFYFTWHLIFIDLKRHPEGHVMHQSQFQMQRKLVSEYCVTQGSRLGSSRHF